MMLLLLLLLFLVLLDARRMWGEEAKCVAVLCGVVSVSCRGRVLPLSVHSNGDWPVGTCQVCFAYSR